MPVHEYLRECFGLCVKFSHGQCPIMHDMYSVHRERRMYTNVPDCTFSMHDQKMHALCTGVKWCVNGNEFTHCFTQKPSRWANQIRRRGHMEVPAGKCGLFLCAKARLWQCMHFILGMRGRHAKPNVLTRGHRAWYSCNLVFDLGSNGRGALRVASFGILRLLEFYNYSGMIL